MHYTKFNNTMKLLAISVLTVAVLVTGQEVDNRIDKDHEDEGYNYEDESEYSQGEQPEDYHDYHDESGDNDNNNDDEDYHTDDNYDHADHDGEDYTEGDIEYDEYDDHDDGDVDENAEGYDDYVSGDGQDYDESGDVPEEVDEATAAELEQEAAAAATMERNRTRLMTLKNAGCSWMDGWKGNHSLGVCYSLGKLSKKKRVNWYTAFSRCSDKGGRLAEIHTPQQQLFLAAALRKRKFPDSIWIGGNDLMHKYMWTWSLNETAVLGFSAWRKGEPNNSWDGGEDCIVLQVGSWGNKWHWNDVSCVANKIPYLCQKDTQEGAEIVIDEANEV